VKCLRNLVAMAWLAAVCLWGCGGGISGTGGIIEGMVLDQNGRPVPQAEVTIPGTSAAAVTDENGYFILDDVSPARIPTLQISFGGDSGIVSPLQPPEAGGGLTLTITVDTSSGESTGSAEGNNLEVSIISETTINGEEQ